MHSERPEFDVSPWDDDAPLASGRSKWWVIWDRFDVPSYDNPTETYLTRWRVIGTPFFGIYLHRFTGPDPRPTLHDHPWRFVSIILRGGYVEVGPTGPRTVRRFNVRGLGSVHYIESLLRNPTWTLMLVGRRQRKWGYVRPSGDGFQWTAFDRDVHGEEFSAALAARQASHKAEHPATKDAATEPCCGGCGRECEHCAGLCLVCQSYWEEHPPASSHEADEVGTKET